MNYYFNTRGIDTHIRDDHGLDLADVEEARDVANALLTEIAERGNVGIFSLRVEILDSAFRRVDIVGADYPAPLRIARA